MKHEVVTCSPRSGAGATPLRCVRSTLLVSGLAILRERGLFDRYADALAPEPRAVILEMIAGVWMPLPIAMAHFAAIDGLGISATDAVAIGAASGGRVHASLLQMMLRAAVRASADPWIFLANYERLWLRMFEGGGFAVSKTGPKDVLIQIRDFPPARFTYFRNAFRGANEAGFRLFTKTAYVSELVAQTSSTGFALRASWA